MRTLMWTPDEIVQVVADAYHAAAVANADMRNAAETLETIRSVLLSGQDPFEIWDALDEQIGPAEVDRLQPVLIELRNRFVQRFSKSEIDRLHEMFQQDPYAGWTEWLQTYAKALSHWRVQEFCSILIDEAFAFEPPADKDADKIRQWTKLVSHERLVEAYDLFVYLNKQELIPGEQRARFFITAGYIQLYQLMKPDKAKKLFQRAEEHAPNEVRVVESWGLYWLQQNEIEKAKDYFQRVIDIEPQYVGGYTGMGDCFEKEGDLDVAEEWYQEAIRNAPGWNTAYTRLISLYGKPALFPTQRERIWPLAKRAISVSDNEYPIYLQLGYAYQQNEKYEEAQRWYDKAIGLDVGRLGGYWTKGYAYFEEGKYDQARIVFQKAIDVAPEGFDGHWGMALVHERLKQWKEALHWFKKSLERRPELEGIIRGRIDNAEWELGKHDEVITRLIDALRLEQENERLTNRLLGFAKNLYRDFDNADAALEVYSEVRKIKGTPYEAEYQNLVGGLKYYYGKYQEAKDAYLEAVRAGPDTAVYHAHLADAWAKLEVPGRRIEAINEVISALEQASRLAPEDIWYREKLEDLQKRKRLIIHFGERSLDMPMSMVTPIAVEVADDLIHYVEGKEEYELSPELATLTSDMRERILKDLGVKTPGIRFRGNEDLPNGTFVIMLMENPVVKEQISPEKRLFPGSFSELFHLEISADQAVNPLTGDEACWISERDWEKVEAAKLELWDVIEYPIRQLEVLLRKNLIEFVGHQEVMNLLETSNSDTCSQIQDSIEHLTALVQVLKVLVSEEVPIKAFELICEEFKRLYDAGTETTTIAERLRSMSEIREKLPGNDDKFSFLQLGQHLELMIHQSIHTEGDMSVLEMEPEDYQNILTAVRENEGFHRNVTLLVENSELRPFVRKLIELEFPHIPVLSQQELLPEFEGKIVGEIELTESQDSTSTQKSSRNFLGGR